MDFCYSIIANFYYSILDYLGLSEV